MQSYVSRLIVHLGAVDVLTHTLPYGARVAARSS
jgi:hypothetical protein